MRLLKVFFLLILVTSCGPDLDTIKKELAINTNAINGAIKNSEALNLTINNPKSHELSTVQFFLNGKEISADTPLTNEKLGVQRIEAKISLEAGTLNLEKKITILSSVAPKVYGFEIINEYPHDSEAYTQGLEFYNGELYESTGQYGESTLRKVDYKTGEVLKSINLDQQYFGEGLTIMNDNIYQLTWQENQGFIYNLETFEREKTFNYGNSKEGWGICHDERTLYKSDGTEKIWLLNPETQKEMSYIQAYHHKGKTVGLNELEFINGKIYANRYQLNGVAIINPTNGAIEGVVDFSALKSKVTQHPKLDVLNGIAFNPNTETIFVTGKYWDKLFEVTISSKD